MLSLQGTTSGCSEEILPLERRAMARMRGVCILFRRRYHPSSFSYIHPIRLKAIICRQRQSIALARRDATGSEQPECGPSSLSPLTRLRKLVSRFEHVEPNPISYPPFLFAYVLAPRDAAGSGGHRQRELAAFRLRRRAHADPEDLCASEGPSCTSVSGCARLFSLHRVEDSSTVHRPH